MSTVCVLSPRLAPNEKTPSGKTPEGANLLERAKGFEPSTHGLGSRYSTTELRPHIEWINFIQSTTLTSYFQVNNFYDENLFLCFIAQAKASASLLPNR